MHEQDENNNKDRNFKEEKINSRAEEHNKYIEKYTRGDRQQT